jgi:hypothetical protein
MSNEATERSPTTGDYHPPPTGEDKKLDHAAQEAAEKAGKTERRFDKDHDIFTK